MPRRPSGAGLPGLPLRRACSSDSHGNAEYLGRRGLSGMENDRANGGKFTPSDFGEKLVFSRLVSLGRSAKPSDKPAGDWPA